MNRRTRIYRVVMSVGPAEIEAAARRINGHVRRTPVLDLGTMLSPDYSLALKLEHTQVTGSFKPRGAFSFLTAAAVPHQGIVAASGGNFGIAAAYAAARLGHRAAIFVPRTSPAEKIDRIAKHGAEVFVIDGYYDDALAASRDYPDQTGALEAHAYDQPDVMAGQGTVGLEIQQSNPDTTDVLVAVGGGGLIGGIASSFRGEANVVAVEPEDCQCLHAALKAGKPVDVSVGGVAASSLGARRIGDHPWSVREWISDSVLVVDDAIVEAQSWLWAEVRLAVEPAAAATLAALMSGAYRPAPGSNVVVVLSGGNVDPGSI